MEIRGELAGVSSLVLCGPLVTRFSGDTSIPEASYELRTQVCNQFFGILFQLKEYSQKAVEILRTQNHILTNHPNSNIYK